MLQGMPLHGWSGRFFHAQNMTFALWDIEADAHDLHEHHHDTPHGERVVGPCRAIVTDHPVREHLPGVPS